MSINNGGPAFPVPRPDMTIHGQTIEETQGMTLRDYFAAKAMQSQVNNPLKLGDDECHRIIAERAYRMASAMLAEREKGD